MSFLVAATKKLFLNNKIPKTVGYLVIVEPRIDTCGKFPEELHPLLEWKIKPRLQIKVHWDYGQVDGYNIEFQASHSLLV
jgi:hypothetical protein